MSQFIKNVHGPTCWTYIYRRNSWPKGEGQFSVGTRVNNSGQGWTDFAHTVEEAERLFARHLFLYH